MYTHYIALFLPLVQLLCSFLFFSNKKFLKYFIISGIVSFALFAPYLTIALGTVPEVGSCWLQIPGIKQLMDVSSRISGGLDMVKIFYPLLFIIGLFVLYTDSSRLIKHIRILILLAALWLIPIIGDFILSQYNPVFIFRYILYASLGCILFTSYFISIFFNKVWIQWILFLPIIFFYQKSFALIVDKAEKWNLLVPAVMEEKTPEACIMITPWYKHHAFSYYYNQEYFKDYKNVVRHLREEDVFAADRANKNVQKQLQDYSKIILIQCGNKDSIQHLILDMKYREIKRRKISDIQYMVYEKYGVLSVH
jgi:hypothetical protein